MDTQKKLPKLKLSLKKETLRPLVDREVDVLDSVVGGTCWTTTCCWLTAHTIGTGTESAQ